MINIGLESSNIFEIPSPSPLSPIWNLYLKNNESFWMARNRDKLHLFENNYHSKLTIRIFWKLTSMVTDFNHNFSASLFSGGLLWKL